MKHFPKAVKAGVSLLLEGVSVNQLEMNSE